MNTLINLLSDYGLFFAKTVTILVTILTGFGMLIAIAAKNKVKPKEKIEITNLNEKYDDLRSALQEEIFTNEELKKTKKEQKAKEKLEKLANKKKADNTSALTPYTNDQDKAKRRIFVLDFYGDMRASELDSLREEITAILTIATPRDEVVVKVESAGGVVYSYGLAASQLRRIRERKIPLTVIVDKVAASGGYMMACVADRILAAPFAILGSIGVIAQLPNFNRLLKKHNIDFEQISAGEYKRTLSMFGENTNKGRQKLQEEIDETHALFKSFVATNRPVVNIEAIATGEHWYGSRAKELRLIDDIITSDDYLLSASENAEINEIRYIVKKPLAEKVASYLDGTLGRLFLTR